MPGRGVQVGPFSGGLNNVSVSGEAQDSEVLDLINLEVGPDASLTSRPLIQTAPGSFLASVQKWEVLGIYRSSATDWGVIAVRPTGAATANVMYYPNGDFEAAGTVVKAIPTSNLNTVTAMAQIDNIVYFCVSPDSPMNGFMWNGSTATDIPTMKKGFSMVAHKLRLWVGGTLAAANNSRVYFSTIDSTGYKPESWKANDYFDAAAGEGGYITCLLPVGDNLLIFKSDGTWRFSYPSSPAQGQVTKVSGSVGAANARSVVEFENYVYVYDQGRLYELINNSTRHLNRFCRFTEDPESVDSSAADVDVSVVARRIVVRYLNTVYAYSVDTKTWSQWRSYNGTPGRFFEMPANSAVADSSTYVAASRGDRQSIGSSQLIPFNYEYIKGIENYMRGRAPSMPFTVKALNNGFTVRIENITAPIRFALDNNTNGDFRILRPGGGRKYKFKINFANEGFGNVTAQVEWLLKDGSLAYTSYALTSGVEGVFYSNHNAVSGIIYILLTNLTGASANFQAGTPVLYMDDSDSSRTLMTLQEDYKRTPFTQEFIPCKVTTKSYDYKSPAQFKRLHFWAADLKTNLPVKATLIPMAVKKNPTWGQMAQYTWSQLGAGTWGNPLVFLSQILDIVDGADPANAQTENGRVLIKFIRGIRFKQLSFKLELESRGTTDTGPAKVHALTTFINPKQGVVEKVN